MTVTTANSVIEPPIGDSDRAAEIISTDAHRDETRPRSGKQPRQNNQPRRDKRDVHGWVVLDKPVGMTSTHAVARVKRLFSAKRAGHAGTPASPSMNCLAVPEFICSRLNRCRDRA